jgi:hypothetical protein
MLNLLKWKILLQRLQFYCSFCMFVCNNCCICWNYFSLLFDKKKEVDKKKIKMAQIIRIVLKVRK